MTSSSFCSVYQESLWLQFMARVDFIDDLVVEEGEHIRLKLIPLGQLRPPVDNSHRLTSSDLTNGERYTVQWLKDGEEVVEFRDQIEVTLASEANGGAGEWTVRMAFNTPAIRLDPSGFMKFKRAFSL